MNTAKIRESSLSVESDHEQQISSRLQSVRVKK